MTKANNSAYMRRKNRKSILSLIRSSPISRAEIAKRTGLTKAAVTIIVEELCKDGLILEEKAAAGAVGRAPKLLYLKSDAVLFLGVNVSRVGISVGITDMCGNVLCNDRLPLYEPGKAYSEIASCVKRLISEGNIDGEKIYKAAVVTPGPVDKAMGKILNPPNFKAWHGESVVKGLSAALDREVIFANVSSAVAVAEMYFGAARERGTKSFLALLVDEGIGSGIIRDGGLFEGSCELGHTSVRYDGERCECGNLGCLECYASVPAILKGTPYDTLDKAFKADGELRLREAEYLAAAITTANNLFDIDCAVLCGDGALSETEFLKLVCERVLSRILTRKEFSVLGGSVTSQSLVAASLAVHDYFTSCD